MTCSASFRKERRYLPPKIYCTRKATWSPPTFQKEAYAQYPLGRKRGLGCVYSQDNATRKKQDSSKAKPILKKKHNFREKDVSCNQDINQCSH
jgi:hypothetical protein